MSTEMIQVPRRLLEELAGYLVSTDEPKVSVPGNGEWSQRMVRDLKRELVHLPGARVVGDHAARRAGEVVGLRDICQWASIGKQQISNHLAGMSKATRRLFGDKRWPFQAVDTAQGMAYVMQPEIAVWWRGD